MTRTGVTGLKPWHLFTEEERAITTGIMRLCSSENPRAGNVPPPEPWMQEINDAMLALLDDAAPYPDEALAFRMHTEWACRLEVEAVDFRPDEVMNGYVLVRHIATGEHWWSLWPCLSPLTIAAHDLLTRGVR